MTNTIYCVSDIHGHYYETLNALKEVGWDENDPNALLLVLGDLYDRGGYSLEIFQWLYPLAQNGKAIVMCGNHEEFLIEWLSGPVSNFNYINNGLDKTIDSFDERTESFKSWIFIDKNAKINNSIDELWYEWSQVTRDSINENFPELLPWLKSLPNYYETKNYLFTHGSIQTYGDWKNPEKGWNYHHWDKGGFFGETILNTDKTIVVGHYNTNDIRTMYDLDNDIEDFSILTRDDGRIIMIDGCVAYTKKVNVLKIENEELIPIENKE